MRDWLCVGHCQRTPSCPVYGSWVELSINPNTIQRAYGELERRGVIYAAKGRGNFISDNAAALRSQRLNELGEQITALAGQARSLGATEEQLRGWVERKGESGV